MNSRNTKQKGFTLIELVMVIAILGVLGATALPRFVDLKSDAQIAAVQGVAGAISAADGVNVAASSVGKGRTTQGLSCAAAANAILQSTPTGVTISGAANLSAVAGTSNTCTVTSTSSATTTQDVVITSVN